MNRSEDKSEGRKASARQEATKSEGDTRGLWLGSKRQGTESQSGGRGSDYLLLLLICLGVLLQNAQGEKKKKVILTYKREERSLGRLENQ